jgi:hypothetical protein
MNARVPTNKPPVDNSWKLAWIDALSASIAENPGSFFSSAKTIDNLKSLRAFTKREILQERAATAGDQKPADPTI